MRTKLRLLTILAGIMLVFGLVAPVHGAPLLKYGVNCGYGGQIKSIEAIDDGTVRFTFCDAEPAFPVKAALAAFGIHPASQLEKTGGGGPYLLDNPIGTGPYKLNKWQRSESIDLVANENYRGPAPKAKNLVIRWIPNSATRLVALESGSIDGMDKVSLANLRAAQDSKDIKVIPKVATGIFFLGISNTIKPFDNIQVRRAIAHAINNMPIVAGSLQAGVTVADQFIPPSVFGYTPDSKQNGFDLSLARQLMKDSGVPLPIKTSLSYADVLVENLAQPDAVTQEIQAQLREIGIEVNFERLDYSTYLEMLVKEQLPLYLGAWEGEYPDAAAYLDNNFVVGSLEHRGNTDPKLTDILARALQLRDPDERLKTYKLANDEIADFVPMVPIANYGTVAAFRANVKGLYSPAFAQFQFALLDPGTDTLAWAQTDEPNSLYCNDETDSETLGICEQINESLVSYKPGSGTVGPGVAKEWSANKDMTEWTFKLVDGIKFSDGTLLNANDVVLSWVVEWDATNPLHKGHTGAFEVFSELFGNFVTSQLPTNSTPAATQPAGVPTSTLTPSSGGKGEISYLTSMPINEAHPITLLMSVDPGTINQMASGKSSVGLGDYDTGFYTKMRFDIAHWPHFAEVAITASSGLEITPDCPFRHCDDVIDAYAYPTILWRWLVTVKDVNEQTITLTILGYDQPGQKQVCANTAANQIPYCYLKTSYLKIRGRQPEQLTRDQALLLETTQQNTDATRQVGWLAAGAAIIAALISAIVLLKSSNSKTSLDEATITKLTQGIAQVLAQPHSQEEHQASTTKKPQTLLAPNQEADPTPSGKLAAWKKAKRRKR